MSDLLITKGRSFATVEGVSKLGKEWLSDNVAHFQFIHTIQIEFVDDFIEEIKKDERGLKIEVIGR